MRQNFVVQFIKLLKPWLCDVRSGIAMEKWALSVDQCWLQALQFSVHLIFLLNIPLSYNGFTRIQKAVVAQTGCRPPTVTMTLFLMKVWLWEVLWSFFSVHPLSWSLLVVILKSAFHRTSQSEKLSIVVA